MEETICFPGQIETREIENAFIRMRVTGPFTLIQHFYITEGEVVIDRAVSESSVGPPGNGMICICYDTDSNVLVLSLHYMDF